MNEDQLREYVASVLNHFIDVPVLSEKKEQKLARHLVDFVFNMAKLFVDETNQK